MMAGAVLTWGLMWPIIGSKAGDWYPANLEENDVRGLFGYQIFTSLAMFLGDLVYKATVNGAIAFVRHIYQHYRLNASKGRLPETAQQPGKSTKTSTGGFYQ